MTSRLLQGVVHLKSDWPKAHCKEFDDWYESSSQATKSRFFRLVLHRYNDATIKTGSKPGKLCFELLKVITFESLQSSTGSAKVHHKWVMNVPMLLDTSSSSRQVMRVLYDKFWVYTQHVLEFEEEGEIRIFFRHI